MPTRILQSNDVPSSCHTNTRSIRQFLRRRRDKETRTPKTNGLHNHRLHQQIPLKSSLVQAITSNYHYQFSSMPRLFQLLTDRQGQSPKPASRLLSIIQEFHFCTMETVSISFGTDADSNVDVSFLPPFFLSSPVPIPWSQLRQMKSTQHWVEQIGQAPNQNKLRSRRLKKVIDNRRMTAQRPMHIEHVHSP